METFTAIFTQLGVDASLLPQFFVILITFVIAHFLFLGKLQSVLEMREEKTVKLESTADETIDKVHKMQSDYKLKIDEASRAAMAQTTSKKSEMSQRYTDQFKQSEKEVSLFVDQSRTQFSQEISDNKENYLSEATSLSEKLISKIIQ
jgi:F0F1-type ATP synthase membrane subunit b/b'